MPEGEDGMRPSRRTVLKSAGASASALAFANNAAADDSNVEKEDEMYRHEGEGFERGMACDYGPASLPGGAGFYFPAHHDICAPDHPEIKRLKSAAEYTLDHLYPNVPTCVAQGAIPYFDIVSVGGFSHWLFPGHINDYSHSLDTGRPSTVLINNNNYCAQGLMFIPPHNHKGHESPVYVEGSPKDYDNEYAYPKRRRAHDNDEFLTTGDEGTIYKHSEDQGYWDEYGDEDGNVIEFDPEEFEDRGTICAPWHYHTDGAARFAWWYNRQFHQGALLEDQEAQFWCHVPGMFHIWPGAEPNDIGVIEHDAPTSNRTGKTACRGGYPNPYTPEDGGELTLEDLPEPLQERAMPAELEHELRILSDFDDVTLFQMSVGEIADLVGFTGDTVGSTGGLLN